jgi:hypothetical protein
LDAKTSDNGYRKRIAAAIAAAGAAQGLSPGQVRERMVDTGGLGADGTVELVRATVAGRASLTADLSVTITWRDAAGWVANPPADAVDADVNAIKRQVRDLRGLVAAERHRVEGLFAEDRGWDVAEWRKYYFDHPITGRIAAPLLWRFGDGTRLGSDADLPASGEVQLCTTDRVWFHRGDRARTAIPLAEVSPLVFSEAMRDVDLFVGVASIALDPNWADRGDDPHYGYWERASVGELTARARVRRDVLSRILPKLAVADRIELGERFVRVRGKLATYKIHLGSAHHDRAG